MSTEMGDNIVDCGRPDWRVEVAVTGGRVRISCFGETPDGPRGGKIFLDQAGTRELIDQLQAAHAYNNWPYPEIIW